MKQSKLILMLSLFLLVMTELLPAQQSGAVYRRSGVLDGNQVKTVFGNWGVIGQPATRGPRGAWIYDTNGYIGDVSPLVGAEVRGEYLYNGVWRDTSFFWVIDCPANRPSNGGFDESNTGVRQAFEPVRGYFNEASGRPALSSDPETWPPFWPDKMDDVEDPGWPGSWNGMFGKTPNADLETYFVMNDDADNEYNLPEQNADNIRFLPDPSNPNRHGLGLEVKVRGLQWQQILAQDNIFWVYEITNKGEKLYPRTVFGMLVGTYVGVTGADDSPQEYDDDWSFFDVGEDLTYTGDYPDDNSRNPFWQGDVGLVGYAFLESPGNPYDGIDNDNDAEEGDITNSLLFVESDFEPTTFVNGSNLVLTDPDNFERTVVTFPSGQDTFMVNSMGKSYTLIANQTMLVEGNVVVVNGQQQVNPNAYDGIDNDLDGLIDENYFLHYRQRRVTPAGVVLFDILNPLRHVNYVTGQGEMDQMLDERRDDGIDNDNDWSRNPETGELIYDDDGNLIDDVGRDGLPGTGDPGEYDGVPTPGEPNFDRTDKSESDQIGLSSFEYFAPAGDIAMWDDVEMWNRLRPGFFDVPESIQNGRPVAGEDGDFTYGSGYFPLTAGQTERLSLALIYGWTVEDIIKKLQIVRQIYDSDYRFPVAPLKPQVTAVAGDDSVVIYWDRSAERSFDPVLRKFDFEGYRIYRSTDPNFNDARVITNSAGNIVAYKPIAQFDLIDNISGWYYPPNDIYQDLQGWSYFMGNETGLQHSWVDYDVENGRTYFYAVVSYDQGDEETGIIPSESIKKITQTSQGGFEFDDNTVAVTPGAPVAGYSAPTVTGMLQHVTGDGDGTISYRILDPTKLTGHQYRVIFWDTSNDGLDNNGNWTLNDDVGADGIPNTNDFGEGDGKPTPGEPNLDFKDVKELESITTRYAVKDLYEYTEEFIPVDTAFVNLKRQNLDAASVILQDGFGNVISDSLYIVDAENGAVMPAYPGALPNQKLTIRYQYYPVYFSPYIQGSPYTGLVKDADIFDGIVLEFNNIWTTEADTAGSGWNDDEIDYDYQLAFEIITNPATGKKLNPVLYPSNYEIRMSDQVVDTTSDFFHVPVFPPSPRKFEIINMTGDYKIEYVHNDADGDMYPSPNERIIFLERDPQGDFTIYTWTFILLNPAGSSYQFKDGDVLMLNATFPFNKFDTFTFETGMPQVDPAKAKAELNNIRVVPNPYIVAHAFEPPLPSGVTSGRGERQLYFTHLPPDSKVHIFTARGDHLITLFTESQIYDGRITWNMKSKENLDIAYGVYFYVVESPYGTTRGKFAVIK
ncbi:MAG: hypothetical protein WAN36_03970 [Calditrichia bacterium]